MFITAIIPIKHYSSRIPGKNYRVMNGFPLYYYIIKTLLNCKLISEIIIDTNSDLIKNGIAKYFKNIRIYDRPIDLSGSEVSTNLLLLNVIKKLNLKSDLYIHTHVTNPLIRAETIDTIIETFIKNLDKYDSLFTVNKMHTRLYDKYGNPINHDLNKLIPTQDLDPIYEENSCLYIVPYDTLIKYERRIGNKPYLYPISKIEAQDIDWEEDFILTEYIMEKNIS